MRGLPCGVLVAVCLSCAVSCAAAVPHARFVDLNGTPMLEVNGRVCSSMSYLSDDPTRAELIDNCRDNGIHLYWLNVSNTPWSPDGGFDFSQVNAGIKALLARDPEAQIVLLVALDNQINAGIRPWVDAHPDELVRDSAGSITIPDYGTNPSRAPSISSKAWQDMAENLMRRLVRHVGASDYAANVVGYMPGNGVTFEWQQWASVANPAVFVDYSEPARLAFIGWLRRCYGSVAALNARWHTSFASFDGVRIPSREDRCRADYLSFLDPRKSRAEIDFRRYYAEQVAAVISRLGRAVKTDPRSSIAVVVDEQSTDYTALDTWLHHDSVVWQHMQLSRTGVGLDIYLLDDLERMPSYRCYLFTNAFRITARHKSWIDTRLKRNGNVLIFTSAPGITDGEMLQPGRVCDITGIRTDLVERMMSVHVGALPAGADYGTANQFGPVFVPREGKVLGRIIGEENAPGLVVKHNKDWSAVYCSSPCISAPMLRRFAALAGVPLSNSTDGDITYVGHRLVAIHTVSGGARDVRCGVPSGQIEELVRGGRYPIRDGLAHVRLAPRSTSIFLLPEASAR